MGKKRGGPKKDEGTYLDGDDEKEMEGEFDGSEMFPVEEEKTGEVQKDVHLDPQRQPGRGREAGSAAVTTPSRAV